MEQFFQLAAKSTPGSPNQPLLTSHVTFHMSARLSGRTMTWPVCMPTSVAKAASLVVQTGAQRGLNTRCAEKKPPVAAVKPTHATWPFTKEVISPTVAEKLYTVPVLPRVSVQLMTPVLFAYDTLTLWRTLSTMSQARRLES